MTYTFFCKGTRNSNSPEKGQSVNYYLHIYFAENFGKLPEKQFEENILVISGNSVIVKALTALSYFKNIQFEKVITITKEDI